MNSDHKISVRKDDVLDEEEKRLTLAFENLDHMPVSLISSFCLSIRTLDLSHNNFSDLSFIKYFPNMTCLILDHNSVNSVTEFPSLQSLQILWLNHNRITILFPFIQRLRTAFPNLQFLSLMANEAVPMNFDDTTFYQHLQYRLFVISWFPSLEHLDDQPVSESERSEAQRLYRRPLIERLLNLEPVSKVIKSVSSAFGLVKNQHPGAFV